MNEELNTNVEGEISLTLKPKKKRQPKEESLNKVQKVILEMYKEAHPVVTISTDSNGNLKIGYLFPDMSEDSSMELAYILHKMSDYSLCPYYMKMFAQIGQEDPAKMLFVQGIIEKIARITLEKSQQPVIHPADAFRATSVHRGLNE